MLAPESGFPGTVDLLVEVGSLLGGGRVGQVGQRVAQRSMVIVADQPPRFVRAGLEPVRLVDLAETPQASREAGRRSLGLQTFWFQRICGNHIVWDVTDVTEFSRKHTANVRDGLDEIRFRIEALAAKRDARKDGFAETVRKAMDTRLGDDSEKVLKVLSREGIPKTLAKQAVAAVEDRKAFSVFSLVDALTRLSQTVRYVGDRTEFDQKVAALFALAM